MKLIVCKYI